LRVKQPSSLASNERQGLPWLRTGGRPSDAKEPKNQQEKE
jgi:hypothetical protein